MRIVSWIAIILLAFVVANKYAVADVQTSIIPLPNPYAEMRYCGEPPRQADGKIKRSAAVIRAFKKIHACDSTRLRYGPCPGWEIDHVIPMADGGCDSVSNMQWLKQELKSAAGETAKDRWERRVYGSPFLKPENTQVTLEPPS